MNFFMLKISVRGCDLVDGCHGLTGRDLLAGGNSKRGNGAGGGRFDVHFHLHGFNHEDHIAFIYMIAHIHVDPYHLGVHRSSHFDGVGGFVSNAGGRSRFSAVGYTDVVRLAVDRCLVALDLDGKFLAVDGYGVRTVTARSGTLLFGLGERTLADAVDLGFAERRAGSRCPSGRTRRQ